MLVERSDTEPIFQASHHIARLAFRRTGSSRGRHGGSYEMHGRGGSYSRAAIRQTYDVFFYCVHLLNGLSECRIGAESVSEQIRSSSATILHQSFSRRNPGKYRVNRRN